MLAFKLFACIIYSYTHPHPHPGPPTPTPIPHLPTPTPHPRVSKAETKQFMWRSPWAMRERQGQAAEGTP